MNLAEVIAEHKPARRCKFRDWIDSLDPEDKATAEAVINNNEYSLRQISRAFSQYGLDACETVVWKHRTNQCKVCA
jgi:hypothetical protein